MMSAMPETQHSQAQRHQLQGWPATQKRPGWWKQKLQESAQKMQLEMLLLFLGKIAVDTWMYTEARQRTFLRSCCFLLSGRRRQNSQTEDGVSQSRTRHMHCVQKGQARKDGAIEGATQEPTADSSWLQLKHSCHVLSATEVGCINESSVSLASLARICAVHSFMMPPCMLYHSTTLWHPCDTLWHAQEANAEDCQQRCQCLEGCDFFTFWTDGQCHVQTKDSMPFSDTAATKTQIDPVDFLWVPMRGHLRRSPGSLWSSLLRTRCQGGLAAFHRFAASEATARRICTLGRNKILNTRETSNDLHLVPLTCLGFPTQVGPKVYVYQLPGRFRNWGQETIRRARFKQVFRSVKLWCFFSSSDMQETSCGWEPDCIFGGPPVRVHGVDIWASSQLLCCRSHQCMPAFKRFQDAFFFAECCVAFLVLLLLIDL